MFQDMMLKLTAVNNKRKLWDGCYDLVTDTWSTLAKMRTPRYAYGVTVIKISIY